MGGLAQLEEVIRVSPETAPDLKATINGAAILLSLLEKVLNSDADQKRVTLSPNEVRALYRFIRPEDRDFVLAGELIESSPTEDLSVQTLPEKFLPPVVKSSEIKLPEEVLKLQAERQRLRLRPEAENALIKLSNGSLTTSKNFDAVLGKPHGTWVRVVAGNEHLTPEAIVKLVELCPKIDLQLIATLSAFEAESSVYQLALDVLRRNEGDSEAPAGTSIVVPKKQVLEPLWKSGSKLRNSIATPDLKLATFTLEELKARRLKIFESIIAENKENITSRFGLSKKLHCSRDEFSDFLLGKFSLSVSQTAYLYSIVSSEIEIEDLQACTQSWNRRKLLTAIEDPDYDPGLELQKEHYAFAESSHEFDPLEDLEYPEQFSSTKSQIKAEAAKISQAFKPKSSLSDPFKDLESAFSLATVNTEIRQQSSEADRELRLKILQTVTKDLLPGYPVEQALSLIPDLISVKGLKKINSAEIKSFINGDTYLRTKTAIELRRNFDVDPWLLYLTVHPVERSYFTSSYTVNFGEILSASDSLVAAVKYLSEQGVSLKQKKLEGYKIHLDFLGAIFRLNKFKSLNDFAASLELSVEEVLKLWNKNEISPESAIKLFQLHPSQDMQLLARLVNPRDLPRLCYQIFNLTGRTFISDFNLKLVSGTPEKFKAYAEAVFPELLSEDNKKLLDELTMQSTSIVSVVDKKPTNKRVAKQKAATQQEIKSKGSSSRKRRAFYGIEKSRVIEAREYTTRYAFPGKYSLAQNLDSNLARVENALKLVGDFSITDAKIILTVLKNMRAPEEVFVNLFYCIAETDWDSFKTVALNSGITIDAPKGDQVFTGY
ncbi:MAG: hypothetical protein R3A13_11775 [Bdellovibrionota bacterium]